MENAWVIVNGDFTDDKEKIEFAHFIRKTNFYWFTMMQKLLDPGVNHKLLPPRTVGAVEYQVVEMTFDQAIGSVQDRYLLYVNPETNLIDQFLFTIKELDLAPVDPMLMQVEYTSTQGIKLISKRVVKKSDWDGKADGEVVYQQHYEGIKFNNGFSPEMFQNKTDPE